MFAGIAGLEGVLGPVGDQLVVLGLLGGGVLLVEGRHLGQEKVWGCGGTRLSNVVISMGTVAEYRRAITTLHKKL
jgi:hypothetical protein